MSKGRVSNVDGVSGMGEILGFWFGDVGRAASEVGEQKKGLWWGKDEAVDEEIRRRFLATLKAAAAGELDDWQNSAEGILALIICMDQFPRNIFRGSADSFAYDEIALRFAKHCINKKMDLQLPPIQRVFIYLPFEHSEELVVQKICIQLYRELLDEIRVSADATDEDIKLFEFYLTMATRHHDIIARFGRFPHRNEIMQRKTNKEEAIFLTEPNSSF